jgi:predicted HTH transcriptional regulator
MKLHINESQNTEFKQSWRDEYIKWLSAFGNTDGGKLYIGVDDDGVIRGIENAKKLLEEIPNKVRDILGILIDVNLHVKEGKEYLEIITEKQKKEPWYKKLMPGIKNFFTRKKSNYKQKILRGNKCQMSSMQRLAQLKETRKK